MKYRFYYIDDSQKWYLMPIKNFDAPAEFCLDLPSAGLFTDADYRAWGSRYEREPIGEDEAIAPMLPGFEISERMCWPGE